MGIFVGPGLTALVFELLAAINVTDVYLTLDKWIIFLIYACSGIISGIIFLFLSKPIVALIFNSAGKAEKKLAKLPANVVIPAVIGLILGLVVAYLLSFLVNSILISWAAGVVNVIIYIICAYLGIIDTDP